MKSKIYILLAIGILMFSAVDVNAQVKPGSIAITPVVGYSWFAARSIYENTETYGAAIGYNFSDSFGIEATYNTLDTEIVPEGVTETGTDDEITIITPGGAKVDAYQYAVEGIFYIFPGKKFAPYASIGIGNTITKISGNLTHTETNGPVGFGFKYFITGKIAVRADLRSAIPFDENNIRATLGISFQLGGR